MWRVRKKAVNNMPTFSATVDDTIRLNDDIKAVNEDIGKIREDIDSLQGQINAIIRHLKVELEYKNSDPYYEIKEVEY